MSGTPLLVVIFWLGFFCLLITLSVRDSRRRKRLDERAAAFGRLLEDWLARTAPCPTCGGSGRILAHAGRGATEGER